jgi:hypothetical protein
MLHGGTYRLGSLACTHPQVFDGDLNRGSAPCFQNCIPCFQIRNVWRKHQEFAETRQQAYDLRRKSLFYLAYQGDWLAPACAHRQANSLIPNVYLADAPAGRGETASPRSLGSRSRATLSFPGSRRKASIPQPPVPGRLAACASATPEAAAPHKTRRLRAEFFVRIGVPAITDGSSRRRSSLRAVRARPDASSGRSRRNSSHRGRHHR